MFNELNAWRKPWTPGDRAAVQRVITAYGPELRAMDQALKRAQWVPSRYPDAFVPEYSVVVQSDWFKDFASLKEVVKVYGLRAKLELAARPSQAATDLLQARRIGERLVRSEQPMIGYLVGVACLAVANRRMCELSPALPAAEVRHLISETAKGPGHEIYVNTVRGELELYSLPLLASLPASGERQGSLDDSNDTLSRILKGHPHPLDRRAALRFALPMLEGALANARRKWSEVRDVQPPVTGLPKAMFSEDSDDKPSTLEIEEARARLSTIDNPLGKYYAVSMFENLAGRSFLGAAYRMEASRDETRLALAAALYQKRTGRFPKRLSDLTRADGVWPLPIDPFSGTAFGYDPVKREIWSLGPEGKPGAGDRAWF